MSDSHTRNGPTFESLPLAHVAACLADARGDPLCPVTGRLRDVLALAGTCRAARAELNITENRFLLSLLLTPEKKQEICDMLRHLDMRVMDDDEVESMYTSLGLPGIEKNANDPSSKPKQMRRRLLPLCEAANGPDVSAAWRTCLRAVLDREAGEMISSKTAWTVYMVRDEELAARGASTRSVRRSAYYNHAQVRAAVLAKHDSSEGLDKARADHHERYAPIAEKRHHTQQRNRELATHLARACGRAAVDALRCVIEEDLRPLLQVLRLPPYMHMHADTSLYDYMTQSRFPVMQHEAENGFIMSPLTAFLYVDVFDHADLAFYTNPLDDQFEVIQRGVNDKNVGEKESQVHVIVADWLEKMRERSRRAQITVCLRVHSLVPGDAYAHLAAVMSLNNQQRREQARNVALAVIAYVLLESSPAQTYLQAHAPA